MTLTPLHSPPDVLVAVQQWLSTAITTGTFDKTGANTIITGSKTLNSQERLNAYLDDYWPRCFDSLTEDFPRAARFLGNKWEPLCRQYLREFPSNQYTLYYLGQRLPQFAQTQSLGKWANDLIQLEWAIIQAEIMNHVDTGEISESTRLYLQPHVSVLSLNHPVESLMSERPNIVRSENIVVFQRDEDATHFLIDPLFQSILSQIFIGKSFLQIFDALNESNLSPASITHIEANIQEWIQTAILNRWITSTQEN